jgi:riboflavin synthase
MFTGIVQALGTVRSIDPFGGGARLIIGAGALDLSDVAIGDSIAVDGVCLTVTSLRPDAFGVDVSAETLSCTIGFAPAALLNLEKALRLADRLGGHLVSGHVDGIGVVSGCESIDDNRLLAVRAPAPLNRYLARKGSVTVNGVSLTINSADSDEFRVNLIPHTLQQTNLRDLVLGSRVNIEVDLIARYVERLAVR